MSTLTFTGAWAMKDIGGGVMSKGSPLVEVLPSGASSVLTYNGASVTVAVTCDDGQASTVRTLAQGLGMAEG